MGRKSGFRWVEYGQEDVVVAGGFSKEKVGRKSLKSEQVE